MAAKCAEENIEELKNHSDHHNSSHECLKQSTITSDTKEEKKALPHCGSIQGGSKQ